jgi:hypothetical protein
MSKQLIDSVLSFKYTYGVTLNLPAPIKGCFVLSRANEFATLKEAVDYADAVRAETNLDCTPTATRTSLNNGSIFQNVVYKVICVYEGEVNPDKVDFWHYPVHAITKERHASMTEDERQAMRREYKADFFSHL